MGRRRCRRRRDAGARQLQRVAADADARDHVGDVWYQRDVRVPRGWDGERVVLRFDSATHRAVVWVDDAEVAEHEGGYTPFEADVTEHVRAGEEARVTVVVNTELRWDSIPPGFVQELEDGRRCSSTSTTSSTTPACTGPCGCTRPARARRATSR